MQNVYQDHTNVESNLLIFKVLRQIRIYWNMNMDTCRRKDWTLHSDPLSALNTTLNTFSLFLTHLCDVTYPCMFLQNSFACVRLRFFLGLVQWFDNFWWWVFMFLVWSFGGLECLSCGMCCFVRSCVFISGVVNAINDRIFFPYAWCLGCVFLNKSILWRYAAVNMSVLDLYLPFSIPQESQKRLSKKKSQTNELYVFILALTFSLPVN